MATTSPVKTRATRARTAAKKAATTDMDAPPRKAVITKAAAARRAKIASDIDDTEAEAPPAKKITTKKEAGTTPAPRRRVKVTPLDAPVIEPEPIADAVPEEPKPKATRSKKATTASKAKTPAAKEETTAPATKSRSKKAAATEEKVEEEAVKPKTRGRPKKTANLTEEHAPVVEAPVRQTRTRAGSTAEATQAAAASVIKATNGGRKKVTFQDLPESDKENVPLPTKRTASKKTATTTATGMRAKPVRKPAAATTRRKQASSKTKEETTAPRALTPKKITQITRSATPEESEEDELNGGKTPLRDLSMSPRRMPGPLTGLSSPVKKLDFTQALQARSPEKATDAVSGILSPARRPPASPFKDALKESPKRGDIAPIFPVAALQSSSAILAAPTTAQSTLLQSPKRGPLDNSVFAQSTLKPQKSPFKASLLQSPARRLLSPQKPKLTSTTPAKGQGTSTDVNSSPNVALSCNLGASQSPERLARVHNLTDDEFARGTNAMVDFDDSVLNIRSPIKLAKPLPVPADMIEEDMEVDPTIQNDLEYVQVESTTPTKEPTIFNEELMTDRHQMPELESMDDVVRSVTGAQLELQSTDQSMPNASFGASKFRDDDESSEDELQADATPERPFAGRPSLAVANIRSRLSTGVSGLPQGMGFTPLASQLGGWRAGSPDKQGLKSSQPSGMFSPVAAQHVPGEVQVSRQSTPQQMKTSVGSRTSVGGRQSVSARKSVGSRLSTASSTSGTPGKSFFADEMALRELEQHSEQQQDYQEELDLHAAIEESMPPLATSNNTSNAALTVGEDAITQDVSEDELTTDLINQTMYTDTALVDMAALAKEAEDLAPALEQPSQISSTSSVYGDENAAPADMEEPAAEPDLKGGALDLDETSTTPPISPVSAAVPISDKTPVRSNPSISRFAKTVVSKVPLRPEGDMSPIKMPKKRSRSLSAGPGSAKRPAFSMEDFSLPRNSNAISLSPQRRIRSACPSPAASTPGQRSFAVDDFGDSTLDGIELPDDEFVSDEEAFFEDQQIAVIQSGKKVAATTRSTTATPARTPLKAVGSGVLHGAVVYVDVHTTEGADASGIFVELLTQMGAKCVKDWRWNPRASLATAIEEGEAPAVSTPSKIGITHVVYKDGGKRTLEKVRDARGEVWCVGVGWVLDCERENKWLDESTYAVDTSIVPRGGSRRRKSMEPRALMNANGSLGAATGRRSVSGEMTSQMREELVNTPVRTVATAVQTKEIERELLDSHATAASGSVDSTFSTPTGVQSAFKISVTSATGHNDETELEDQEENENLPPPATPTGFVAYDPATDMSPATPFLMGAGSKLVQMSCPPKQSGKALFEGDEGEKENSAGGGAAKLSGFPVTGRLEDEKDEGMRRRLEAARRRTMGWRPRVGSPLGRME